MNYTDNMKLDARPDRIDLRDREYVPPLKRLAEHYPPEDFVGKLFPLYIKHKMVLDQGKEGACTGFGLAAMINYLIWRKEVVEVIDYGSPGDMKKLEPPEKVSMRMLYHLARFYDEWPGEDYDGSSCRGAVKAWHKHGVCREELWPYRDKNGKEKFIDPSQQWDSDAASRPLGVYYRINKNALTDLQAAIQEVGAIYVSGYVHKGWNVPSSKAKVCHENLPLIQWQPTDDREGGHAFALVGYSDRGFIIQNSWGTSWGMKGFALIGYDDWLANGTDAWACIMGVPKKMRMPSHFIASKAQTSLQKESYAQSLGFKAAKPVAHEYQDIAVQEWSESEAYNHTVVMGNDGRVINRLVTRSDAQSTIDFLAYSQPKAFFKKAGARVKPRLAIYAHGGLNAEEDSIERIKIMAPYFEANRVYPLFFTWKTGFIDSLTGIMEDAANRLFDRAEGLDEMLRKARQKAEDVLDRTLEIASANLGVKALWSQMKQNAAEAAKKGDSDRGGFLTTLALAKLLGDFPELEIHLIGHSAGSLILGHMLGDFPRNNLSVKTFSLYAPACSIDFANRHIQKAMTNNVLAPESLHMHLLTDQLEKDDTVGPYRKSLLYLVSRALEDHHKTPLLGLANAFDPAQNDTEIWSPKSLSGLKRWQKLDYWESSNLHLLEREYAVTARKFHGNSAEDIARIDAAHGSFDNDVDVVEQTIKRILGKTKLKHRVENLRF